MKILIAMPSGDLVHKGFCISLANLIYHSVRMGVALAPADIRVTTIERGRNIAVRAALDEGASHIFWLDSDMTFPPETLIEQLKHDKDIVGCSYRMRREPHVPTHRELAEPEAGALHRVARLPGGMLLVKIGVYQKLDLPWYRNTWVAGAENIEATQDFDFCDRARALGYEVWLDAALSKRIGHLGEYEYRL